MTRLRTQAACYESAVRENRLHKLARPADVTDAAKFPNIAAAMDEREAMGPVRRAELDAEWEGRA